MTSSLQPTHTSSVGHLNSVASFDFNQRTRVVFGCGTFGELGKLARELGGQRVLLVTDAGIRKTGYCAKAETILRAAGLDVAVFDEVQENPTSEDVDRCAAFAKSNQIGLIVGLGGGSCIDCAKGANFVLTNGGTMHDYKGVGKAKLAMLPMIAVPTTSGTGSEAQSFAVIADAETHMKMACGDPKAACRIAILDPELTVSMPASVAAATGIDAMTHAIESYVTTKRNPISQMFARQAWEFLSSAFPVILREPENLDARGRMQLGAFLAGAAIENSMLGAAHAAANPLTAQYGTTHGIAVGLMLPHVIRWNADVSADLYRDLVIAAKWDDAETSVENAPFQLADGFTEFLRQADLPVSVSQAIDAEADDTVIETLAAEAAQQWTGTFNPRAMDMASFVELYRNAL
jgi:alcohol dehydrogenase